MNDFEREDLKFVLSLKTDAEWADFLNSSSEEDIRYALRLVQTDKAEKMIHLIELDEALQTEVGLDCKDAMSVINRVKQGVFK